MDTSSKYYHRDSSRLVCHHYVRALADATLSLRDQHRDELLSLIDYLTVTCSESILAMPPTMQGVSYAKIKS
jgi:hypothetical protein